MLEYQHGIVRMKNIYLSSEKLLLVSREQVNSGANDLWPRYSFQQPPNATLAHLSVFNFKGLFLTSWLFRVSSLKITLRPLNRRSRSKVSQLSSFPSQKQRTYKVQWYLFHWHIKKNCHLYDLRTNLNDNQINVDILNPKNRHIGPRNCPQNE